MEEMKQDPNPNQYGPMSLSTSRPSPGRPEQNPIRQCCTGILRFVARWTIFVHPIKFVLSSLALSMSYYHLCSYLSLHQKCWNISFYWFCGIVLLVNFVGYAVKDFRVWYARQVRVTQGCESS